MSINNKYYFGQIALNYLYMNLYFVYNSNSETKAKKLSLIPNFVLYISLSSLTLKK